MSVDTEKSSRQGYRLTEAQTHVIWSQIMNHARNVIVLFDSGELEQLRSDLTRAETLAPFVDPTLQIRMDKQRLAENHELLDATIAYVRTCRRIAEASQARAAAKGGSQ